ncbi:Mitochondrial ribosome small subunit biogenesis protein [Elasticomyces elasticus]|nr:Mitochondrial ribosome small subunit biogenesis protein [Elasticomyces elasticus]KAK3629025.1 Mitochondrial ribosome small subunit biogenesis protein [Elasticomyces elasticus]KAK4908562.1 Mitochondrial ribosome small subunit biogenesis protein [Elasticomyces elasticus]KAK5747027.1 Mitochondrial ribosome small subunit biogenesis protein [Elasticomyces elasticus]
MLKRLPIRLRDAAPTRCLLAPQHQLVRWIKPFSSQPVRRQELAALNHEAPPPPPRREARSLPTVCPGCGAHTQTVSSTTAGFYDLAKTRNSPKRQQNENETAIFQRALSQNPSIYPTDALSSPPIIQASSAPPVCDRCHELQYQNKGTSVIHPSMQSIQDIIEESPHKQNHIYHVLDAADFPLSLIPNLAHSLNLPRLRTRNRRSKTINYTRGRVAEVSFIITRSDLLAPKKEQVDALLPYLREVLRDALGRRGREVRLGGVRCVSAKRGWWTKVVKEEVYRRKGGGWMVGKVNVGKSALVGGVFPKGRGRKMAEGGKDEQDVAMRDADTAGELAEGGDGAEAVRETYQESELLLPENEVLEDDPDEEAFSEYDDALSLLPPAQPETAYPLMPLVSALPGTTASPIRIPFGGGKGELIDLPGVHRSSLDQHVRDEHHKDMVMTSRIAPEQFIIRPGQSLLLGGLLRVTPRFQSAGEVMLAYPFLPAAFAPHVTGTHKAIAIQTGQHSELSRDRAGEAYEGRVSSIATEEAKEKVKSAGTWRLEWDVTKRRSGPLTDVAAGKQKAKDLPFVVYSMDLLVEGVGWVELVCQTRKPRDRDSLFSDDALSALEAKDEGDVGDGLPEIEVYSPEGKFVGGRRPMGAEALGGRKREAVHARRGRGRMSIGMTKRRQQVAVN